jgi:hypothetical protein
VKKYKSIESFHKIDLSVWGYSVFVVFAKDFSAAAKELGLKHHTSDFIDTEGATFHTTEQCESFLFFTSKNRVKFSTIAHECWHAVRRLLDYSGASLDNETVAYHLGFLVESVCKLAGKK